MPILISISKETSVYLAKKFIRYFITLFVSLGVTFLIPRLVPGDPILALLVRLSSAGGQTLTPQTVLSSSSGVVRFYVQKFGLDKDLFTQFILYINNLFHWDFGPSIMAYPRTVSSLMIDRIPWTIGLLITVTLVSWVIGNVIGAFVGWSKRAKTNAMIISTSMVISQIPYYILSLVLIYIFAVIFPVLPIGGGHSIFTIPGFNAAFIIDVFRHSMLPALSIILVSLGTTILSMRGMMQHILGSDYLRFAETKGLKKNVIMMRYAFRNALLPQVTGLGLSLGFIMSGAMLTEWIFSYPGMGTLFVTSLAYLDYNVMQGIFVMTIFGVLTTNLLLDLIYPLIDPRVKSS